MKYFYTIVILAIVIICVYLFVNDGFVMGVPIYIYLLFPYDGWLLLSLLVGGYYVPFFILIFFLREKKHYYAYVIVIGLIFFGLNAIAAQYVDIGISIFDINFGAENNQ